VVTSYPVTDWEAHLKAIDGTLPILVGADSKICYYVDVSQTCYPDAMSKFLGLTYLTGWTATAADCAKVLEEQRAYLESVAARLFGPAIPSATDAKVTDFELLTQSWVLRVGHHALVTEHSAFRAVINGIVDWKTVHCDEGNLLYDTSSLTSDLVGLVECDILDNAYPTGPDCTNGICSIEDGVRCAALDKVSSIPGTCTMTHEYTVDNYCNFNMCTTPTECCTIRPNSFCCTG